jgi:hypothetical protein
MAAMIDTAISGCVTVNISSGDVMLGLDLPAMDLMRLARAQLASISNH